MCRVYKEKDIAEQKFGKLTAIEKDLDRKNGFWLFKCDCGNIKSIYKYSVIKGNTANCGCTKQNYITRLNNVIESFVGKKFSSLTVISFSHVKRKSFFNCVCECTNTIVVPAIYLKNGNVKSCGCKKVKYKPGELGLNGVYSQYKKNAKTNKREFNLNINEFRDITSKNCEYCGAKPSLIKTAEYNKNDAKIKEYSEYKYNGIDRVDSSKGYTLNNVVTCCEWCNRIKRERTVEDFKKHIIKLHDYLNLGKIYE